MSAVDTISIVMLRSPRREIRLRPSPVFGAQQFFSHATGEFSVHSLAPARADNAQEFYLHEVSDAPYEVLTLFENPDGMGDRGDSVVVTTDAGVSGFPMNLVDGDTSSNNSVHSMAFTSGQTGREVRFAFQGPRVIDALRWISSGDLASNSGWWRWEGSQDGASWTPLSYHFMLSALDSASQTFPFIGSTLGYRLFRIRQYHGATSSSSWQREAEFRIGTGAGVPPTFSWDSEYSAGNRSTLIDVTTTLDGASGSVQSLVNGAFSTGSGSSYQRGGEVAGHTITFEFQNPVSIRRLAWLQDTAAAAGQWRLRWSDDGLVFHNDLEVEDEGATFALGGRPASVVTTRGLADHRFWQLLGVSGTMSGSTWVHQVEFGIGEVAAEDLLPAAVINQQEFYNHSAEDIPVHALTPGAVENHQNFFEQEVEDVPPVDLIVSDRVLNAQQFFHHEIDEEPFADLSPALAINQQEFFGQELEPVQSEMMWEVAGLWDHSIAGNTASPINFTGLAGAEEIAVIFEGIQAAVAVRGIRVSTDNGSTWYDTSGDYVTITAAGVSASADWFDMVSNATQVRWGSIVIGGNQANAPKYAHGPVNSGSAEGLVRRLFVGSNSPINAVQARLASAGNFTNGRILVLVRRVSSP